MNPRGAGLGQSDKETEPRLQGHRGSRPSLCGTPVAAASRTGTCSKAKAPGPQPAPVLLPELLPLSHPCPTSWDARWDPSQVGPHSPKEPARLVAKPF